MLLAVFVTAIPALGAVNASKIMKIVFFVHPGFAVGQVSATCARIIVEPTLHI